MRTLGKVHRTQIWIAVKNRVLLIIQNKPQIGPVVAVPNLQPETSGSGEFQLPKKRMTPSILTRSIMAYSASMIIAQRNPEYSVWKPATISDSASGRSKGALLLSASDAIKNMIQAGNRIGI